MGMPKSSAPAAKRRGSTRVDSHAAQACVLLNTTRSQRGHAMLEEAASVGQIGDISAYARRLADQLGKGTGVTEAKPLQQLALILARVQGEEGAQLAVVTCVKAKVAPLMVQVTKVHRAKGEAWTAKANSLALSALVNIACLNGHRQVLDAGGLELFAGLLKTVNRTKEPGTALYALAGLRNLSNHVGAAEKLRKLGVEAPIELLLSSASDATTVAYATATLQHIRRINSRAQRMEKMHPDLRAQKSTPATVHTRELADLTAQRLNDGRSVKVIQQHWRQHRLARYATHIVRVQAAMRGRLARRRFGIRVRMVMAHARAGGTAEGRKALRHAAATTMQKEARRKAASHPLYVLRLVAVLGTLRSAGGGSDTARVAALAATGPVRAKAKQAAQAEQAAQRKAVLASVAVAKHSRRAPLGAQTAAQRRQLLLTPAAGARASARLRLAPGKATEAAAAVAALRALGEGS
ncbi:hypothetical protein T492DRAFT_1075931, partial [Pavlovales sp. CCMP2436]